MNLSTVKWAQWDKTQSRELLVCSYVCALHCAQLLHTILHRTDLIIFPLTPPDATTTATTTTNTTTTTTTTKWPPWPWPLLLQFNGHFVRCTQVSQFHSGPLPKPVSEQNLWALDEWVFTDAKMILTAPPPEDWKRPPGRPHITWLNTVQQDLRVYNLTLNKPLDLAQNRRVLRLMSTYGTTYS